MLSTSCRTERPNLGCSTRGRARPVRGIGMDVGGWLRDLGLGQYEQAFGDNDIDAGLLPTLTADDLRELGVVSLGHRKRLLAAIVALAPPAGPQPAAAALAPAPPTPTAPQAERRQ